MPKDLEIQTTYEIINASGAAAPVDILTPHTEWIPAAKEGQVIKLNDGLGVITREGLESSVGTWKNGNIFDDHNTPLAGFQIHGDKFISPYLYFLLDEVIVAHLGKSAGGSIDAFATKIDGNKVTGLQGKGYSVLSPGLTPSCTKEAGCGIPIAGAVGDVNITKKDGDTIVNDDIADPQQNIKAELKNKGGSKKEMTDEKPDKPEVTYSAKQVADIRAAAVAEVTEQLDNAHKVGVADMEAATAVELKTLGETHAAELETQRELVTKQVGMIESLAVQYSLSDEAKKALTDAKTLEDALALFAGLAITKPIAGKGAAEGKEGEGTGSKGGGIVQGGASIEAQAPKTVKVEEVGNYDAVTGKYIPTFREELI
jgi:hypothetical protein